VQDVTEIESALSAEADLQADLVANVPACLVLLNAGLQVRFASRGLLGHSSQAMRGTNLLDHFDQEWREQIRAGFERCGREHRNVEIEGVVPLSSAARDRRYRLHIAPALGRDPASRWCVAIRDISHALRDQSQAFGSIDSDLQRIGHDLRESVGQQLTGVALLAQSLSAELARERHVLASDAARIAALLTHSIEDVRALARSLSPVGVAPAGIAAALEGLAADARAAAGVDAHCRVELEPGHVPSAIEADHLFGIAQEAVSNAVRHSGATRLWIRISAGPGRLDLAISDDGQGMGEVSNSVGLTRGLALMTHRARAIGATLIVSRPDGGGTSIRCLRLSG
jgi:signal transduction histidine kinase